MPAPLISVIPAGASNLNVPGPIYGFVPLDLDTTATYSTSGSVPAPLSLTKVRATESASEPYFTEVLFSSTIMVRVMIARTRAELDALPDAPNSPQTTNQTTTLSNGGGTGLGSPGNPLYVYPTSDNPGSSNVVVTSGTGVTGPVNIAAVLTGGTGVCSGIQISNTGAADNVVVTIGGNVVVTILPGQTVSLPIDPNHVSPISLAANTGVISYGAIAYYHA